MNLQRNRSSIYVYERKEAEPETNKISRMSDGVKL